jgi:flagellin
MDMPLGVLNNISAIYAENNLNQTQSSLQNTLTQLSSGSRINSGADDAAGLSIANGLQANSSALTQSSSNATAGVGFLQVADGALSQVTNLLNRAVTLATEAGGGTLSTAQMSAADQEYQDILSQINTIGSTTEYNGIQVFSSDISLNALTWAQGSATAGATATAAGAADLASTAITAGGVTSGAAATLANSYDATAADETALTWTPQSTNGSANNIMISGPIGVNQELTGQLTFTPNASTGSPATIDIDLGSKLTAGTALGSQAAQLQSAMNTAAGNVADYSVSVVNGDQLEISLGTHASTDNLTGFAAPTSAGSLASQTAFTMTVADGDTLGGSLTIAGQSATAAGSASPVSISGSGTTTATLGITGGNVLSGTLTVNADVSTSTPAALSWSSSGTGLNETWTTTVTSGYELSGGFTVTSTGTGAATTDVNFTTLSATTANLQSKVGTALGSDYTVSYNATSGALVIGFAAAASGQLSGAALANDSTAASEAFPTGNVSGANGVSINLAGVTTSNLANTVQAALGSDYTVGYANSDLTISMNSSLGTTDTVTATSSAGITQATAGSTSTGSGTTVSLNNLNTANLASKVQGALGANYVVSYSATGGVGTLTVISASSDMIGMSGSGTITQTAANQASIAVTDGDSLGGNFSISQTIDGTAQQAVTVDLTGATANGVAGGGTGTEFGGTSPQGQALVDAVNTALGTNAQYYNVAYNVNSTTGIGTLTLAVNAIGAANNVSSVSIANGTSTNALYQTQTANSTVDVGSSVLGNFTLTPSGSSSTPINVNLTTTDTADLAKALQSALGANYLVGYNTAPSTGASTTTTPSSTPVPGSLSIGISQAGIAAGITGFTVTEATTQAASVVSTGTGGVDIYTSDGTATGSKNYNVTVGGLSDTSVGTSDLNSVLGTQITATVGGVTGTGGYAAGGSAGTSLSGTALTSQSDAEAALQTVDNAISAVAYQRGQVGANINTLTAASNIAASEETNVQSAQNNITQTDYASATSNMSKYEILTQTGISALAQANSTQQMVLKLLQ